MLERIMNLWEAEIREIAGRFGPVTSGYDFDAAHARVDYALSGLDPSYAAWSAVNDDELPPSTMPARKTSYKGKLAAIYKSILDRMRVAEDLQIQAFAASHMKPALTVRVALSNDAVRAFEDHDNISEWAKDNIAEFSRLLRLDAEAVRFHHLWDLRVALESLSDPGNGHPEFSEHLVRLRTCLAADIYAMAEAFIGQRGRSLLMRADLFAQLMKNRYSAIANVSNRGIYYMIDISNKSNLAFDKLKMFKKSVSNVRWNHFISDFILFLGMRQSHFPDSYMYFCFETFSSQYFHISNKAMAILFYSEMCENFKFRKELADLIKMAWVCRATTIVFYTWPLFIFAYMILTYDKW